MKIRHEIYALHRYCDGGARAYQEDLCNKKLERGVTVVKTGHFHFSLTKVIHILSHSLSQYKLGVDVRFYEGDWHVRFAKEILKQTNKYENECWRPERTLKEIYIREGKGMTYRIFPSFYLKGLEWSMPLLKELRKIKEEQDILIHLHGIYNPLANLISYFLRDVPIVGQSLGDVPWLIRYRRSRYPLRSLHLLKYPFERKLIKNIDHYFVFSEDVKDYLSRLVGADRVEIQPVGADFGRFKPLSKSEAREKLSLDHHKKYILYVGRLDKEKGLDYLMTAFQQILGEYPETMFLLVGEGPYKSDLCLLAERLKVKEMVRLMGYVDERWLPLLYNAADVFVLPSFREGSPVTVVEALACGIPAIATEVGTVRDIFDSFESGTLIAVKSSEAIYEAISQVFQHQDTHHVNREKAIKRYDSGSIARHTIAIYDGLSQQYYGRKFKE